MSHSRHCSKEQSALIKKSIGKGKANKDVQNMIG